MAIKGAESKEKITKAILSIFEGSFINEKNIIIPMSEGGEPVQIKVALTASKTLIQNGSDTALPGESLKIDFSDSVDKSTAKVSVNADPPAPTEEEKANVLKMMAALGL